MLLVNNNVADKNVNFGSEICREEKKNNKKRKIDRLLRGLNQAPPKLLKLNDGRDKAVMY